MSDYIIPHPFLLALTIHSGLIEDSCKDSRYPFWIVYKATIEHICHIAHRRSHQLVNDHSNPLIIPTQPILRIQIDSQHD